MTLYTLLWTVAHEGSSLLGVYASRELAEAAWDTWREGLITVRDDEREIREVTLGADARME